MTRLSRHLLTVAADRQEGGQYELFPEAPPAKYVEVPIVVRFGDTDPFGVVFFASYFRYCHQGIEEFFRNLGLQPRDVFATMKKASDFRLSAPPATFSTP